MWGRKIPTLGHDGTAPSFITVIHFYPDSLPSVSKLTMLQLVWLQGHKYTAPPSMTSGWLVLAFGAPIKTLKLDGRKEEGGNNLFYINCAQPKWWKISKVAVGINTIKFKMVAKTCSKIIIFLNSIILKQVCTKKSTHFIIWSGMKVRNHWRQWWLMTFADIRPTLSSPFPQIVWKEKMNINMAGWVFLINLSLHSSSTDISLSF